MRRSAVLRTPKELTIVTDTLVRLIEGRIDSDLAGVKVLTDQELLDRLTPWLDEAADEGLFAGTPLERFRDWFQSTVVPHLRKLGELGQKSWEAICDPDSEFSKERIATVVLSLGVLTGLQQADLSTLVAIALLAIRSKKCSA
jgi:hypothetical protein